MQERQERQERQECCRNELKRVSEMSFILHNRLQPRSQSLTCNSLWGNIRNRKNLVGSVFKVRGAVLQYTLSQNVTYK